MAISNFSSTVILLFSAFVALWSPAAGAVRWSQLLLAHNPALRLASPLAVNPLIDRQSLAAAGCGTSYVVKSGDTLSNIAAACGVSTGALAKANNIKLTDTIYPGQSLTIPKAGGAATTAAKSTPAPSKATCTNPYTVRQGDTLGKIAKLCGVSIASLRQWNGLPSDKIQIGQRLYTRAKKALPLAPSAPAATPAPTAPAPPPEAPAATPTAEIEPPQVK